MGFYVYFYGTDIMNQIKSSIEINKRSFLDEIFLVLNQIFVSIFVSALASTTIAVVLE